MINSYNLDTIVDLLIGSEHRVDGRPITDHADGRRIVLKKASAMVPAMQAEGFTPEEAYDVLLGSFLLTASVTLGSFNVDVLAAKIGHGLDLWDGINSIPAVAAFNPTANYDSLLRRVIEIDKKGDGARLLLRYLDLWVPNTRPELVRNTISYELEFTPNNLIFATYSRNVITGLKGYDMLIGMMLNRLKPYLTTLRLLAFNPQLPGSPVHSVCAEWLECVGGNFDRTDDIKPVSKLDEYKGSCGSMSTNHYNCIIDSESPEYGKVVLVNVNGVLSGAIKMETNATLIGLRNVIDSQYRIPLVIGGVYSTRSDIVDLAKSEFKRQGQFAAIDLPSLNLFPLRFIYSEDGPKSLRGLVPKILERRVSLQQKTLFFAKQPNLL